MKNIITKKKKEEIVQNEDSEKLSKAFNLPGSALIFTMFILSGMLIVAMSGAYIILTGIIASGLQSQSTRAYFAAEAGAEKILWDFRKQGREYSTGTQGSGLPIEEGTTPDGAASYKVYHTYDVNNPQIRNNYTSVGTFNNIRRSVEISF